MLAVRDLEDWEVGKFIWIGSDGWSSRWLALQGLEDVLEGAVTVQPQVGKIPGFDKYFQVKRFLRILKYFMYFI